MLNNDSSGYYIMAFIGTHLIAVNDSLREVTGTYHFSILLSKLYNVLSMSAKNQRQLKDVANNLNDQVMRNVQDRLLLV